MLNKIKNLFPLIRQKPVLIIIFVVILVALIIPFKKPAKKQFENLPEIHLQALNPSLKPATAFSEISTDQPIKQIAVYQISPPTQDQLNNLFNPIVREFNFSNLPENIEINKTPHLFWNNAPNFLTVNLQSGTFTLDLHPPVASTSTATIEVDALNFARNWLLKYNLITEEANYKSARLTDQIGDADNRAGLQNFQLYFYPTVNNLSIFTPNSIDAPISVIITPQGDIYSVYYRLPAVLFTDIKSIKTVNYPVLSSAQIDQAIKDKKPTIARLTFSDGRYVPSTANIKTINYQQIVLGYSNEIANGFLLPVFQLTGIAALEDGSTVNVTAYLPALAN